MGVVELPTSATITTNVRQAMAKAWEVIETTLPDAPENGVCSCGHTEFIIISEGIAGVYATGYVTDHWHSHTGGWDDIDDTPLAQWLACTKCDTAYKCPDVEWN